MSERHGRHGRSTVTAKSVQFSRFGGTDVLEVVDEEIPSPGPDEVVVEVLAAGINHMEAFIREGRFDSAHSGVFPQRQGTDLAGFVAEAGSEVHDLPVRTEVVGHAANGSHAGFVVVPRDHLVRKPASVSWEVGGALFLAGVAAYRAVDAARIGPGDTVVVTAAAGGVGSLEVQLAKLRGARVIGTCGERNFDYLRQIGIRPVVYGDDLAERLRAEAPDGVTAYLDNFGGDNAAVAAELGIEGSRFQSSDDRKEIELRAVWPDADTAAENTRILGELVALVAAQSITVLVSGFYPLEHVREAFDDLEKRHARGKIVLGMRPVNPDTVRKARDEADRRA